MPWIDATPLWLIGAFLTLVFVVAEEAGIRLRRFASGRRAGPAPVDGGSDDGVGNLVGAALGLLALIFAFTFAMAQDRYDQRRGLVMTEARAVGTGYLRFQAFDEPERSRISAIMAEYAVLRSRPVDAQRDRVAVAALVARTEQLQSQMWTLILSGLDRRPELTEPVMESAAEMFEVTATRRAVIDARIPGSIQVGLVVFSVTAAFFTGYGLSVNRRHRVAVAALFLMFTSVYLLIQDLDRSYSGPIRVSQTPMVQAADRIGRLEAARLALPNPGAQGAPYPMITGGRAPQGLQSPSVEGR